MRRYTRTAKYRKKHYKPKWLIQVVIICYAFSMSASLLTSETSAYFSHQSETSVSISTAENWWDQSELVFIGNNTQNIKKCAPHEISVEIKNEGSDMADTSEFEVYYVENGNPSNPQGEKIDEGEIPIIEENETIELTYLAEDNGVYKFKAFQREGYEGDHEEIWSEMVRVNCNAANSEKDKDNKKDEEEEIEEVIEEKEDNKEESKDEDEPTDQEDEKENDEVEEDRPEEKQNKEDEDQTKDENKYDQQEDEDNNEEDNEKSKQDDLENSDVDDEAEDESEDGEK
ncbi:amyloid fiber anchoring/assembly protein TapA [Alkalibacillus silvisoli]|uniref:Amyloid fiber anchoring/assembly protein TapA n=1 Tax=Alkalibacillus silvisoli TaxID=392823 RepID=A0ABN1A3Y6_9BACI